MHGADAGEAIVPEPVSAEAITPEVVDSVAADALAEETPELHEEPEPPAADRSIVPADPLQRYLAEIRRIPLLSREEEHALAVRWKEQGDREAAIRLVTANLRLVVMIARDYQRAVHNLLDLVQEGNVGLLEAIKNFDPYRGVRFPSYAVWWIRAYIIRYVMNNWRMVKVGTTQAQRKLFFNLQKERQRLEREGFSPTPKLIAQGLGVKEREVVEMQQRLSGRDVSVDAPVDEDDDATMLDFLASPAQTADAVATEEYHELVRRTMAEFKQTLSGKDLVIYERRLEALMHDEDPDTLQTIGDEYGITRERVRQIEARLKKRLGAFLRQRIPDVKDIEFGR
ncbi:MAG TPA: RNA polymerase factor sigma-32 [Vicinamibacterales bacterium]|nr:RNA polymerase factor sigma-32 [Vicinamibacterales bacterium]